jgi:hypothetical protein
MTGMSNLIDARLQALAGELAPIRQTAERLVDQTAKVEASVETILISHRPAIGTEAYAIALYPGVPEELIADYEQIQSEHLPAKFTIPGAYRTLLQVLNGAEVYQMSLYGLPISMSRNPPLLNRSLRQPLDLATANIYWKTPYRPSESQFNFGSGPYSEDENLAYFLNPDRSIEARRTGGVVFGTWVSLEEFLAQEIPRVESLYPSYESRTAEFLRELGARGRAKRQRKK